MTIFELPCKMKDQNQNNSINVFPLTFLTD